MIKRYNLTRSDNFAKTGISTNIVSGTGTFKVTTDFPTSSAIITNTKTYSYPTTNLSLYEKEYDFEAGQMNFSFSPPSTIILDQIELIFSRGYDATQRDYSVQGTVQGESFTL